MEKYLREFKKKELEKRYEEYYNTVTVQDKEKEMDLIREFAFSDRDLELFLQAEKVIYKN